MFYNEWGFAKSPFETTALPPSEEGDKLIVGRDDVIKQLLGRLGNTAKMPTVEGLNGVGKTSLINVATFRAFRDALKSGKGPLYIPCGKTFQLDNTEDPKDFRVKVLLEVAQTLIDRHSDLPIRPGSTKPAKDSALDRFINNPQLRSFTGTVGVLSAGYNSETNTGFGFAESGLEKRVENWLKEIFPAASSGGVVCIIDNLELLQTSQAARETLENLRDTIFSITGIRWVLSGALGIVHGVASSPRLDGRLQRPIVVEELEEQYAVQVFRQRVKAFRTDRSAKLPISEDNFVLLFDVLRGNIRTVLSECDEFCTWVSERVESQKDFSAELFDVWIEGELRAAYEGVRSELRPAALKVFDTACEFEVFSPSDCFAFGYDTPMAMRPQIKSLEEVGLLVSSIDETDRRRKTIQVTPKGWKVRTYLDSYGADT